MHVEMRAQMRAQMRAIWAIQAEMLAQMHLPMLAMAMRKKVVAERAATTVRHAKRSVRIGKIVKATAKI